MAIPAVPAIPCRKCVKRLRAGGTGTNPFFPFCSERCRNVDMGQWLDEAYRVPVEDPDAATAHGADGVEDAGVPLPEDAGE